MTGFRIVNLKILIEEHGKEFAQKLLSDFSCPLNTDVEYFLHKNAIIFSEQSLSQTHLVFASYQNSPVLVGYFTLANKYITVSGKHISKTLKKRLSKFAPYDSDTKGYCIAAPLIAQIGKNYAGGYNSLISGDELLKMACDKVSDAQLDIGGKVTYLECEDKPQLLQFYERNGFCVFDRRDLDPDETDLDGEYLVQLLKYLR